MKCTDGVKADSVANPASLGIFCILSTTLLTHYPPFEMPVLYFLIEFLFRSELLTLSAKLKNIRALPTQTFRWGRSSYRQIYILADSLKAITFFLFHKQGIYRDSSFVLREGLLNAICALCKRKKSSGINLLKAFKNAVLCKGFDQVPILRHKHAKYIQSFKIHLSCCSRIY